MNIKQSLSNKLKKTATTITSKNTASMLCYGIETMPESLKKTR